MNKGVNTIIVEAKAKLVESVNEILKEGVPIAMVDIMLDLITMEIKNSVKYQVEQEQKEQSKDEQHPEQVEWKPEENLM